MSEPFLAEVKIVGFNFAPRGFALCDGQLLPISQNQSLFSLLGTNFGGDGRTNFALPDLRSRVPVHIGSSPGGRGGTETNVLTDANLPVHTHEVHVADSDATASAAADNLLGKPAGRRPVVPYGHANTAAETTPMFASGGSGTSSPVNNVQPYLALNFCIALTGLFPSRN